MTVPTDPPPPDEAPARNGEKPDGRLLELLVCPLTKSRLVYNSETSELISPKARLAYPIRRGVPHLVPSEARNLDA